MKFTLHAPHGLQALDIPVRKLIVAGWAGRDRAAMAHHIEELAALGVPRPTSTPVFYRVSATRLTQDDLIQVSGEASSGEVEFLLVRHDGETYVGVGSDHTDREVETYGITVSKQMCDKPCANALWRLADVAPHWDALELRSFIHTDAGLTCYQRGAVSGLLSPEALLGRLADVETFDDGTVVFGGTLPALGGIRPAARFAYDLHDPVLGRTLHAAYHVVPLPLRG